MQRQKGAKLLAKLMVYGPLVIFLAVGVGFCLGGFMQLQSVASRDTTTTGTISRWKAHNGNGQILYEEFIRYEVNGKNYLYSGLAPTGRYDFRQVPVVGSTVPLKYQKSNPANVGRITETSQSTRTMALVGLGISIVSAILLFKGWRYFKKSGV